MAKLEIAEFDTILAWGLLGAPSLVHVGIEIAAISAKSVAFSKSYAQFTPRADCRIQFGLDPAATANSEFFPANTQVTRVVNVGHKMAVILA
jgi:hypothetical protein